MEPTQADTYILEILPQLKKFVLLILTLLTPVP